MEEIKEKIKNLRYKMLIHSCLYYRFCTPIVEDKTFDRWARELVHLQHKYKKESKEVIFYEEFKDWDGTTGFHLPITQDIEDKSLRVINYHREKNF